MLELKTIVKLFAKGMMDVDSEKPVAVNARSKVPYSPGIGPHTERQTVKMVVDTFLDNDKDFSRDLIHLEIPYATESRSRSDLCIGEMGNFDWAVEIKMLRFLGDNGKPNDNILMHILSPYPANRSAVTDCLKIYNSGIPGKKAVMIYGYDYPDWPMDPAIEAFELLAGREVVLSQRIEAHVSGLVHPFHKEGRVFGWEVIRPR